MDIICAGQRRPSFVSGSMPTMSEPSFDRRKGSVTTLYEVHEIKPTAVEASEQPIKAFNRAVILWTVSVVIICYHQMAFASLIPVYFLDEPRNVNFDLEGGLGYTVHDVGAFMPINGVIALTIQAAIFPAFKGRVGVCESLVSLLILRPISYIVVPFLSCYPDLTSLLRSMLSSSSKTFS
jgi:hypothetical protein